MATNPFEQFGGKELPQEELPTPDLFAEFGGTTLVKPEPAPTTDPFANYGGMSLTQATSVTGKPLSPEAQERLAAQAQEKKAYGGGFFGTFDVLRPEAREAIGGFWNAIGAGKRTSDADIKALAEKYEIDYNELRSIAPFIMAIPEERSAADVAKQAAGYVGEFLGGIPQFLLKKSYEDPKFREAIDDLRELGEERMGLAEWTAVNILPAAVTGAATLKAKGALTTAEEVAKAAAKTSLKKEIAKGAAVGAAFGLGNSRENQEILEASIGATVGGAATTLAAAAPKVYSKIKKTFFGDSDDAVKAADPETQKMVLKYAKNNETDITAAIEPMYESIKKNEDVLKEAAIFDKAVAPEDTTRIVQEMLTPAEKELAVEALKSRYLKTLPAEARKDAVIPEEITGDAAILKQYVETRKALFVEQLTKDFPEFKAPITDLETGKVRPATTKDILRQARRLGDDELRDRWNDQVLSNLAQNALEAQRIKFADNNKIGTTLANFFGGKQFGFKVIDEKKGYDTLQDFYSVNRGTNLVTSERQRWRRFDKENPTGTISGIYRAAKRIPNFIREATKADGNKYYTALAARDPAVRQAAFDALTDGEKQILSYITKLSEAIRERANSIKGIDINPLGIPKREDFGISNQTVKPTEYIIRLKSKLRDAEASTGPLSQLNQEQLADAIKGNTALKDFVDGLRLLDDELITKSMTSGKELMTAAKYLTEGQGRNTRLYRVAGTALARRDQIPEYLLDTNLFRVLDRYMDTTLRNVYTRRPLERLASKARVLKARGAETEAAFIERFIQDHYGVRAWSGSKLYNEGVIAVAGQIEEAAKRFNWSREKTESYQAAARFIPEAIASLQYNIYPNVLGMNGKSHITNLMQSLTKGAPELGGLYGYQNISKAFTTVPFQWNRLRDKVKKLGLQPDTYIREYSSAMEDGLGRSTAWQYTKEQYQNFVKAWMWSYEKVEDYNRAAIVNMAERLARDLNSGNRGAMRALDKMPLSVRRAYIKAQGNLEAQERVLADHINNATAYNYNRASLAEVGVHLGPFFSTFLKWPTETVGDILADMRTKGVLGSMPRLLEKYAATWALLNAIDSTIYWATEDESKLFPSFKEADQQLKYWIGSGGLRTGAPIASIAPLVPGTEPGKQEKNPFVPAIVDTLWNGILAPTWSLTAAVASGEDTEAAAKRLQRGSLNALQTYQPFGFIQRFLLRDYPMAVEGEEPIKLGE